MSLAWQTLQHATRILDMRGAPRKQLMAACFKLAKLRTRDLPAEAIDAFEQLMRPIPRYPLRNLHEAIRLHVEALEEAQIRQAIDSIYRIRDALAVYQPRPQPRHAWMSAPGRAHPG